MDHTEGRGAYPHTARGGLWDVVRAYPHTQPSNTYDTPTPRATSRQNPPPRLHSINGHAGFGYFARAILSSPRPIPTILCVPGPSPRAVRDRPRPTLLCVPDPPARLQPLQKSTTLPSRRGSRTRSRHGLRTGGAAWCRAGFPRFVTFSAPWFTGPGRVLRVVVSIRPLGEL